MNRDQLADPQHAKPYKELTAAQYRVTRARRAEAPSNRVSLHLAARATA